jgi:hypothetical protein
MDLQNTAQEILGPDRAAELRSDLEQLSDDLQKLRSTPVEPEDEP